VSVYNPTQATSNDISIYAHDVQSLALALTTLTPGRRTSPSKCGATNINTYSNRSLLTCTRLRFTTKRLSRPWECA